VLPVPRDQREGPLRRAFPISTADPESVIVSPVIVYAILDTRSSSDHPLGDAVETLVRREEAERFIEEVRGDDPDLANYLRIEERELETGDGRRSARRSALLASRSAYKWIR